MCSPSDSNASNGDSDDSLQEQHRPSNKFKKDPASAKPPVKVYNKIGKPILLASAKRQIRRQKVSDASFIIHVSATLHALSYLQPCGDLISPHCC